MLQYKITPQENKYLNDIKVGDIIYFESSLLGRMGLIKVTDIAAVDRWQGIDGFITFQMKVLSR